MTNFTDVINDPYAEKVYLVRVYPYDPINKEELTLYYSDSGFLTSSIRTPENTYFEPRLINPGLISRSLTVEGRLRGFAAPDVGDIVLFSGDDGDGRNLDDLILYYWDGRDIDISVGSPTFSINAFERIYTGKIENIEFNFDELIIRTRDPKSLLQNPIQINEYAGTGGTEGPASLKGELKPICFGLSIFEPVYLGVVNGLETFQYHDAFNWRDAGPFQRVLSNGVELTEVGTRTALDGSPGAGEFTVDETQGIFQIGGSIGETVILCETFGGQGVLNNDVSRPGEVIEQIIFESVGSDITFESGTISNFDALFTVGGNARYHVDEVIKDDRQILDVISSILESVGGYMTFNGNGEAVLGRLESPRDTTADYTFDEFDIIDARLINQPPPLWRGLFKYAKNWRVLRTSEVAGSVSDDERSARIREFASAVVSEDNTVNQNRNRALNETFRLRLKEGDSPIDDEADRTLNLFKQDRRVYEIDIGTQAYDARIGDVVEVTNYNRLKLDSGENFIIVGQDIDGQTDTTTLRLWGGALLVELVTESGDIITTESGDSIILE